MVLPVRLNEAVVVFGVCNEDWMYCAKLTDSSTDSTERVWGAYPTSYLSSWSQGEDTSGAAGSTS